MLENNQSTFVILRKNSDDYTEEELGSYKVFINYFTINVTKYYSRKIFISYFYFIPSNYTYKYAVEWENLFLNNFLL